jgi:hypothetical protein
MDSSLAIIAGRFPGLPEATEKFVKILKIY